MNFLNVRCVDLVICGELAYISGQFAGDETWTAICTVSGTILLLLAIVGFITAIFQKT